MAIETPDWFVEWATGDDSELADPGASLKTDGFAVGDAPASSHFNYLLHAAANWSEFLPTVNASSVAWGNIVYSTGYTATAGSPWGDDSAHFSVVYREEAGRWYVLRKDTGTTKLVLLDSVTGEDGSWTQNSDVLGVAPTHTPYREFSLPEIGGGRLVIGGGAGWLAVSTDYSVENLQAATQPFDTITSLRGLAYHPVSKIWVAAGEDSGNGYIETSSNLTNWTVVKTAAGDPFTCLAINSDGNCLACTDNGAVNYFSDTGSTWSSGPDFGAGATDDATQCIWSEALGAFIVVRDNPDDLILVEPNNTTEFATGLLMGSLALTNEFVWTCDPADEHAEAIISFGDTIERAPLGEWLIGKDWSFTGAGSVCIGGQGKLIMPWYPNEQKAVAYYGAQKETR
jgi:hypothetical protein